MEDSHHTNRETVLEVRALRCTLQNTPILRGVDLALPAGSITVLLGPNGAGKSTLLALLSGCLNRYDGEILLRGEPLDKHPKLKNLIGYLPDTPPLYPDLTVTEQLYFSGRLHGLEGGALEQAIDTVMQECELQDKARQLTAQLSKGYRQRTALAQALLHKPALLLLDEPTEGLDPGQILKLRELLLSRARQGTSILLSTHLLDEAQQLADQVLFLHQGRISHAEAEAGSLETRYRALFQPEEPA